MLVEPLEVDGRRQLPALQSQEELDNACDARRRQAMTDIALHRAQRAVPFFLGILLKGVPEAFHLDRVTQFRARAMGLYQLNARRIALVFVFTTLSQARLRFRIGRGD